VEQNRALENLRHERNVNPVTVNRATVVRPLGQLESHGVKVVHLPKQQHEEVQKSTEWYRQVQHERQTHASQFIARRAWCRGAADTSAAGPPSGAGTHQGSAGSHDAETP
jgi:hypothetical protein